MPEDLADRFRRMPDELLLRIATEEGTGLTQEAVVVLNAELQARNLGVTVNRDVFILGHAVSEKALENLVESVQRAPCPVCGRTSRLLNAGWVVEVWSVILFTAWVKEIVVACPSCLKRRATEASRNSTLFGWWGVPMGPIRTIAALGTNSSTIKECGRQEPSDELRTFIKEDLARALEIIGQGPPGVDAA